MRLGTIISSYLIKGPIGISFSQPIRKQAATIGANRMLKSPTSTITPIVEHPGRLGSW
jgi:hypothetical protein